MGCASGGEKRGSAAADEVGSGIGRWDGEKRSDAWAAGPGARVAGRDVAGVERTCASIGAIRSDAKAGAGALSRAKRCGARGAAQRKSRCESKIFSRAAEGLFLRRQAWKIRGCRGPAGDFAELVRCLKNMHGHPDALPR